jgi:hypothetical protein
MNLLHDVFGVLLANAMDVLQRDNYAFIGRDIHPCDAGHDVTPVRQASALPFLPAETSLGGVLQAITRRHPPPFGAGIVRTVFD